jgi:diadenosine tetraphosphate (Ap4A) HIT family hydrolase
LDLRSALSSFQSAMVVHRHHNGDEDARHSERRRSLLRLLLTGRICCPSSQVAAQLVLEQDRPSPPGCVFREIAEGKQRSNVVAESELAIVMTDKFPACERHLLVIPREPIRSVLSLRYEENDVKLLDHMVALGREALRRLDAPEPEDKWRFCFHVPPMTSVDHLHLHCLAGKLTNKGDMKFKYNYHYLVTYEDLRQKMAEGLDRTR